MAVVIRHTGVRLEINKGGGHRDAAPGGVGGRPACQPPASGQASDPALPVKGDGDLVVEDRLPLPQLAEDKLPLPLLQQPALEIQPLQQLLAGPRPVLLQGEALRGQDGRKGPVAVELDRPRGVVIAVHLAAPGLGGHLTAQQGGGGALLPLQVPLHRLGGQLHGLGNHALLHLDAPVLQKAYGLLPGLIQQAAALKGGARHQRQGRTNRPDYGATDTATTARPLRHGRAPTPEEIETLTQA